ncbi:TetR/AcrR family transcriptional regulator [Actinocrispum sp. NPDC049592]|uniref:TetR/AcrR family transcriptional regulator n=1 Tax=Actinocrispum sp. NPDC049592 TaxID=3154835 RepID=UPI003437F1F8
MPKILGESLAAHREQVRAKVFEAMRTLLYTRGFDGITLTSVATAAGVGRTAIYNHFPDREALLVAFVEHETSLYVQRLQSALSGVTDPVEALAVFVRMHLEVLAARHMPPGEKLNAVLSPEAYSQMSDHVAPITSELRTILAQGMSAGQMTSADINALIPMIMGALAAAGDIDVEAAVGFILRATGVRRP